MYGNFKTQLDAFWQSFIPPIFFLNIVYLVPKVSNSSIFQKRCFMKIIWHLISIQTLLFQTCLPTLQNGVKNRHKAYWHRVVICNRCFRLISVKPWLIYLSSLELFCLVIGVKVHYNFRLKLLPTIADHQNIKTCHNSSSFWFLNLSSVTLIGRVVFPYQAENYSTYFRNTKPKLLWKFPPFTDWRLRASSYEPLAMLSVFQPCELRRIFVFMWGVCWKSRVRVSMGGGGGGNFEGWRLLSTDFDGWRLWRGNFFHEWKLIRTFGSVNINKLINWRQFFSCVCPVTPSGSADYFDNVKNRRMKNWRQFVFFAITRSQKGQNEVKTRIKNARNLHFKIWRDQNHKLVSLSYWLMEKGETFY